MSAINKYQQSAYNILSKTDTYKLVLETWVTEIVSLSHQTNQNNKP